MNALEKLDLAKALWLKAMPVECPLPDDWEFLLWVERYASDLVETGIIRSAKKMRLNLRAKRTLMPQAAQRYCTSVMTNLSRTHQELKERAQIAAWKTAKPQETNS